MICGGKSCASSTNMLADESLLSDSYLFLYEREYT